MNNKLYAIKKSVLLFLFDIIFAFFSFINFIFGALVVKNFFNSSFTEFIIPICFLFWINSITFIFLVFNSDNFFKKGWL